MHSSVFFKLFPPPKFLTIRHSGLDISDDAIRSIAYAPSGHGLVIEKSNAVDLPEGLVDGGDIKDEKRFGEILREFDRSNGLSYVKVSVPEEKAYLFETDVPSRDVGVIEQNIEFKLEENVPLAAPDAVFYFDLLPERAPGKSPRASVSVVPRTYIERYLGILRSAGMSPVAFEVVPKSIARAIVPKGFDRTQIIVHIMNRKTGLYVVSGGVVAFTSTIGWGGLALAGDAGVPSVETVSKEIIRVYSYWMSRGVSDSAIDRIVLVGQAALSIEPSLSAGIAADVPVQVAVAEVWRNVFDLDRYIPPISKDNSLDYAVAAGLAMDA